MNYRLDPPTLSAIVPVHNGSEFLAACLDPLYRSLGPALSELWVVDDASTDDSAEIAERFGAQVLRTMTRSGPAAARNLGAERARGDVLVFVDADVVIHPTMLYRVREAMCNPARSAVFGCYDDHPPETNYASLYVNLRHHLVHRRNAGATTNFWSGFGAVRRGAFLDLGGFDAKQFPEPSVEDIEFGHRLAQSGGRILLDPGMLCTHHKRWSFREVLRTDCLRRALPWSQLLARHRGLGGVGLNVSGPERLRALLALALLAALALSTAGGLSWWMPGLLAIAALAANRDLGGLLWRRSGAGCAVVGLAYHQLYYLYSTGIYAACWLAHLPHRLRRR